MSAAWAVVVEDALPEEQEVLYQLGDLSYVAPAPTLGAEVGDGIPVAVSWPHAKVALDTEMLDETDRRALEGLGWQVVAVDTTLLRKALGV